MAGAAGARRRGAPLLRPGPRGGPGGHLHRGLSRTVCRAALAAADGRPVQLSTQAQSWPAVVLYESLGFRPWERAWGNVAEGEAKARWARARKAAEAHGARL